MDASILDTIDARVLGDRLKEARQQRGLTQADAAQLIDSARTTITAIEKGDRRIRPHELIQLAHAYGRQISDFVRERLAVELFAVQFRSAYRRSQEHDVEIEQYIERFENLCRDYLELEQVVGAPLPHKYPVEYRISGLDVEQAAEGIAQQERNRLGLGDGPIPLLRDLLEQDVGLRIFYLPIKPSHVFSAMYAYDPQVGGCIAVNSLHPEERRRLSLAHDYAHFLVHRRQATIMMEDEYQRRPESERFADAFARHFLMPAGGLTRRANDIRQSQGGKFTPADLCTLAHYYGASVEAMTRRLEELRLVPAGTWEGLKARGFKVQEARQQLGLGPLSATDDLLPKRYQYLAVYAYNEGKISEGQLARSLQTDRLAARELVLQLGEETDNVLGEASPTHLQLAKN